MLRFYSSCVQKGSGAAPQPTSRNLTHVTSWCATHRQQDVGRLQVRGGGVGVGGVKGGSQRATVTIDWRRSSGMNYDPWCIPERAEPRETWDVDSHFFFTFHCDKCLFFFFLSKIKINPEDNLRHCRPSPLPQPLTLHRVPVRSQTDEQFSNKTTQKYTWLK